MVNMANWIRTDVRTAGQGADFAAYGFINLDTAAAITFITSQQGLSDPNSIDLKLASKAEIRVGDKTYTVSLPGELPKVKEYVMTHLAPVAVQFKE